MKNLHAQRGQALIETAFFLPAMLLALFAVIYFSQFGVLQERAPIAARYETMISNAGGQNYFTLEQMYKELHREVQYPDQPAPTAAGDCVDPSAADAVKTLTQDMPLANAAAGPVESAPPWFRPTVAAKAGTSCTRDTLSLPASDPEDVYAHYTVQHTLVFAKEDVPGYIQGILGGTQGEVAAGMSSVRPESPGNILYCSPNKTFILAQALGPSEPITKAGPYGGFSTPPPGKTHLC